MGPVISPVALAGFQFPNSVELPVTLTVSPRFVWWQTSVRLISTSFFWAAVAVRELFIKILLKILLIFVDHDVHMVGRGFGVLGLWDESYDDIPNWQQRVDRIIQIVRDFDPRTLDNPVVQQKLLHNSARFFDKDLRTHLLNSTMINPLLEFVNA